MAMTVLLRVKRSSDGNSRARRRDRVRAGHPAVAPPVRRALGVDRRTPPTQDRALYNCGCGFVFSEDVSTSVACPHCGDSQAW